jgi:hypothetical protein
VVTDKISQHKVVIQLNFEDIPGHKSLMKQLNNILTVSPDAKIETVAMPVMAE